MNSTATINKTVKRIALTLMLLGLHSASFAAESSDVTYFVAESIRTSKGKLPPCSPLTVVEDRGKKFKMRMASGLGHSFSASKKQFESDRYATLEECTQNTTTEIDSDSLLRTQGARQFSVGDPIQSALMALGRADLSDIDVQAPSSIAYRWVIQRPSKQTATRYIGGRSLSWDRLKNSCEIQIGVDADDIITTLSMLECLDTEPADPAISGSPLHIEQRSGLALAAYRGQRIADAFDIWLDLAESGHAPSQFRAAALLYNGDEVPRDIPRALHWFHEASEQRYNPASYQLGLLYLNGEAVERDLIQAYRHLHNATVWNFRDSKVLMKQLEEQLSEAEISEAISPDRPGYISYPKRIESTVGWPGFPREARVARTGGTVSLRAIVRPDGFVDELVILGCSSPGYGFEFTALESVAQWRYEPALQHGKPVGVYFNIQIDYSLR